MAPIRQITSLDVVFLLFGLWLLLKSVRILRTRAKSTLLKGPGSKSWIFGNSHFLAEQKNVALVYEEWAEQYGAVFRTPIALGRTRVVLCDPKAIQHFYSKGTYGYIRNSMSKLLIKNLVRVLVWTAKIGETKVN